MNYIPKYCCQCGEKVEREKTTLLSSGRFCELCQTDFTLRKWTPSIIVVLSLIFGVVGFFGFAQTAEKPLKMSSARPSAQFVETRKEAPDAANSQIATEKNKTNYVAPNAAPNAANTNASAAHQTALKVPQPETPSKTQAKSSDDEAPTYFCGAATKKGTPCSRRVKGGGRCWQHAGQAAILPPEKLLASR
jgi:hypothetical protein